MIKNNLILNYEYLAELMAQMLAAAKLQDWDKVTDLELFYQDRMAQIKIEEGRVSLSKAEQAMKLTIIKKILKNDHELKSLIHPRMDELSKFLRTGPTKAKLNRTYGM